MSNELEGYEEMQLFEWWGIPTMLHCPHDTDPNNSDTLPIRGGHD